jgi:adenine-specific DNA-methyltransferase
MILGRDSVIFYYILVMNKNPYLTTQIITYMGNKRKLLYKLEEIIDMIRMELQSEIITADAFSGSGIVSRLLKNKSHTVYVNDIAGYSKTLNMCHLSTPTPETLSHIKYYIQQANTFAHTNHTCTITPFIQLYWGPAGNIITNKDRAYYTRDNAILIDKYMHYIQTIPKKYQCFLIAQVILKASIHTNTNGQFSAYFKDSYGIGKYGGIKEVDIKRITKPIRLDIPIFSTHPCTIHISQMDVHDWVTTIPPVDVMYLDPPYNKHPYSIYYFMLDIINTWNTTIQIPNTNRGQPRTWVKSPFNSIPNAEEAFTQLINNIMAKFIIVSYFNKGIISIESIIRILSTRGKLYTIPVKHSTYNKFKGIANYKRVDVERCATQEYIFLLDLR